MPATARPARHSRLRSGRASVNLLAGDVLGTTVDAAVPLHSLHPRLVIGAALVEIVLFALLIVTGSVVVLVALVATAAAYVALHLIDRRAVLALAAPGDVLLAAGRNGRPREAIHPVRRPRLPEGKGLAVPMDLGGRRWWVDRSAYPLLRQAAAVARRR